MNIVAGMATISRRESCLRQAVLSLIAQVDRLYVYLNDYETIPTWLNELSENGVVHPILGCKDLGDLGDAGKFRHIEQYNGTQTLYFSVDDDIVYPETYVKYTKLKSELFSDFCFFSYHGRFFFEDKLPLSWYFKAPQTSCIFHHFAAESIQDTYVHFGGTGVMCINLSKVKIPFELFSKERNMADIFVGIYAQKIEEPIVLLSHSKMWIRPSNLIGIENSIYDLTYSSDSPKDIINRELFGLRTHLNIYNKDM